ncbi:MAG: DUF3810 domain-containing protein [Oscillospiraceae bacterium]|nr:DUF3810 domain-containing protein [Oscillospiraceae bacterium]
MKERKSKYRKILLTLLAVSIVMNIAGCFPRFCDWYGDHVYGILADAVSILTARIPVAVGEVLMYLGILLVLLAVIFLILLLFLRKKQKYRKFCGGYFKALLITLVCVVFVYTFNWVIPFRGTVLGQGNPDLRTEYDYQQIAAVFEHAVSGMNAAAKEIPVADDGSVQFPTAEELHPKIAASMQALAPHYPRLSGYYPPVKTALCSDILNRMNIGGYNYPYTMEPTHNKYVSPTFLPVLDAHELSHHKGYYKENEANLLSQIALAEADDPFLRFSGFYDMYCYLDPDYTEAREQLADQLAAQGLLPTLDGMDIHETPKEILIARIQEIMEAEAELLGEWPELSERAGRILDAANQIEREVYEADAHPIDDMPAVQNVIEDTADFGWETQADILQENSYDGVTLLLLQYYEGKLY